MASKYQGIRLAEAVDEVILFCAVDRNALEIMIGDIRQKCCHKIVIGEPLFQARDCHTRCGMGMHDAVRIFAVSMNCTVNYVTRKIDRVIAVADWIAIQVNLNQV